MNALKNQMDVSRKELQETRQLITNQTSDSIDKAPKSQEIIQLRKEVSELTALVSKLRDDLSTGQTSQPTRSTGRSWASATTPSSALSPATRTARAELGFPIIRLETSQASPEAIALLQDPIQLQQTITSRLGQQEQAETIRIEGVKTAPRNIIKVQNGYKLFRE
jgi:hypothetical protein